MPKKDKKEINETIADAELTPIEEVKLTSADYTELIELTIQLLTTGGKKMEVKALVPYEFNNKIHTEEQVNRIANSIAEFGFTQPLVCDKHNVLIIGHGRLEAAKKLGLTHVPVVIAEHITPEKVKKLRLLDNKLNESERNLENLKLELNEVGELKLGDETLIDLFPEFKAPKFNEDEYGQDEETKEGGCAVVVFVADEAEAKLLTDDLVGLGYTKFKINGKK